MAMTNFLTDMVNLHFEQNGTIHWTWTNTCSQNINITNLTAIVSTFSRYFILGTKQSKKDTLRQ